MNKWMNEWNEWMNEWMNDWMNKWMNKCGVNVRRHEKYSDHPLNIWFFWKRDRQRRTDMTSLRHVSGPRDKTRERWSLRLQTIEFLCYVTQPQSNEYESDRNLLTIEFKIFSSSWTSLEICLQRNTNFLSPQWGVLIVWRFFNTSIIA